MIETRGLSRHFGATKAVEHLDLRVEPGEILGLLGPNGAGKTTTVKILTCMIKPTSGSASVAGFDVERDPLEVKRRLGYVPEAGALYETLTAGEYLTMVANLRGIDGERADRKINEFLDLFDVLDARDRRLIGHSLSMVGLVVAMVILIEFRSVVISPTDYDILAHQPVSSRTYFLVKLTNVLLYSGIIGALVAGPTWIFFMVRYGLLGGAPRVRIPAGNRPK